MGHARTSATLRPGSGTLALAAPLLLAWAAPAQSASEPAETVRAALAAVCDDPDAGLERMAESISGAQPAAEEPLSRGGRPVGWERRFALSRGGELRIERFAPAGRLRRLAAEYWAAAGGDLRPQLAAVADGDCTVRLGRRLVYEAGRSQAIAIEHLDRELRSTGERAPLDPPVPAGRDPGGVPVALVDSGVNYLLPQVGDRLARDESGTILGHDYWDDDARPFDAHPVRSPFFPQRHGTRTASLLLHEAPEARLVPYRYPRPDMGRMRALIADAAKAGAVVVNVSMGSAEREEWEAFAAAAKAHPDLLFVLSAGNDGRDIEADPVYPAAMALDNTLVATSSLADGALARGSNWGRESVDLLVPAERLRVTGFDGDTEVVSGSSYAAVRVSALAARLLADHPGWRAEQLGAAIRARVLPPFAGASERVAAGFMPRPDKAERLPPLSGDGRVAQVQRQRFTLEPPEDAGRPKAAEHVFRPTFALLAGSGWTPDRLRRHGQKAALILAQCGVRIPQLDVRTIAGPAVFGYFHEAIGRELVDRVELPKPTVYFVRDTLQIRPFDAEAIGRSNSHGRPALRDTIWFTESTRDPGVALAHELAHVLMDSGEHVNRPGNLMRGDTAPSSTALDARQCRTLVEQGRANGLLAPAGRGEPEEGH